MHRKNDIRKYCPGTLARALRASLFTGALLAPSIASAAIKTWVGTTALMGTAGNWSPSGVPTSGTTDVMQFNGSGTVANLTFAGTTFDAGGNSGGIGGILMTSGQTGPISITKTDAGSTMRFAAGAGITIDAGAGAFSIGTSGSTFNFNLGQDSAHPFINNSSNAATIGSLVSINASGGNRARLEFGGTGDWQMNAVLLSTIGNSVTAPNVGLTKSGTGTLSLNNANLNVTGTLVTGGVLRLNHATALTGGIGATGGGVALTMNGGIVGLGNGDFSRGLGTGTTQVQFTGSGGFAAYTADRNVNLGGATAAVTWGTGSFIPTSSNLILGAVGADKTVTFQNPINLGGANRTVQVDNGSANIDGVLNGVLSNGGLTKTGNGSLALTKANTYTGPTTVSAGTLVVGVGGVGSTHSSSAVSVGAAGTLAGSGTVGGSVTLVSGATISPGNSTTGILNTGSTSWVTGANYNWQALDLTNHTSDGNNFDFQNISGTLDIQTGFNFNLWSLSDATTSGNASFDNSINGYWRVAHATTLTNGANLASAVINTGAFNTTDGFSNDLAGGGFTLVLGNSAGITGGTANDVYLKFTAAAGGTPSFIYTDTTDVTLNVLRNGTLSTTKDIKNNGSASGDAILNSVGNLTVSGTLTGVTTNGERTLMLSPTLTTGNGTTSGTLSVTPDGGANDLNVTVTVGNASFAGGDSSVGHGTALTAATPINLMTPYTNLESNTVGQVASGTSVPALGTTATILAYTNSTGSDNTVSMAWRSRKASEASTGETGSLASGYLISDVVDLTGMVNVTGVDNAPGQTDVFVLQMSYDVSLLYGFETAGATGRKIFLAYNDGGIWVNAVLGNIGGTSDFVNGAYTPGDEAFLGRWGVNTSNHTVWAVLNHNSEFAVIPEPSSLVLGSLALLGFAGVGLRRRRLVKQN